MTANAIQLPKVFDENWEALRSALERQAEEIDAYVKNTENIFQRRLQVTRQPIRSGTTIAHFNEMTRVIPTDSQTIDIHLPRPNKTKAGLSVGIARLAITGTVVVHAPNSQVNGQNAVLLNATTGMNLFWFDGVNYYGDKQHGFF